MKYLIITSNVYFKYKINVLFVDLLNIPRDISIFDYVHYC